MKLGVKSERLHHIDMLRGIAMFVMILIHTNAYFLWNNTAKLLWNMSQFAVPVFIFCSSYLYFYKNPVFNSIHEVFMYIKRRFVRLLQPYYVFAIVFTGVIYLKEPAKITTSYIFQNIFVIGGIDINWLVFLFLVFAFITPLLSYSLQKNRPLFYFFVFCSFLSSILFIFYKLPFNYRYVMWLPWSIVLIVGYSVVQNEKRRWFFPALGIFSFGVFIALRTIQVFLNHSLIMYDNKYPPNLYHLSYGIFSLVLLHWLVSRKIFHDGLIHSFFSFLSKNSYSLYFIHYTVLFILALFFKFKFTWVGFFVVVLIFSICTQIILNFLTSKIQRRLSFLNVV